MELYTFNANFISCTKLKDCVNKHGKNSCNCRMDTTLTESVGKQHAKPS